MSAAGVDAMLAKVGEHFARPLHEATLRRFALVLGQAIEHEPFRHSAHGRKRRRDQAQVALGERLRDEPTNATSRAPWDTRRLAARQLIDLFVHRGDPALAKAWLAIQDVTALEHAKLEVGIVERTHRGLVE